MNPCTQRNNYFPLISSITKFSMTSVIPMENNKANVNGVKMKFIHDSKEEARSFLNFSQENLNISQTDQNQKFKSRFIPSRNTILSSSAVMIAVLCLSLEGWTLQCSLTNIRELQQLKKNVESLKEQFIQSEKHQNVINQLKTLEQQLYNPDFWKEDSDYDYNYDDDDDDDDDEDDNDNNDDDDDETSSSYYPNLYTSPTDTSKSSDLFENTTPGLDAQLTTMLKAQTTSKEEEFKKDTDSIKKEHRMHFDQKEIDNRNNTEHKRDVFAEDNANTEREEDIEKNSKAKRFVTDRAIIDNSSVHTIKHQRIYSGQHQTNMTNFKMNLKANDKSDSAVNTFENSTLYMKETDNTGKSDEQNTYLENKTARINHQKYRRSSTKNSKKLDRKLIRRNLRIPRQVRAIHYGADSTLFSANDEHTGNGRARHNSGVFKAWRPSDWVTDLGMDRFFMFNDGKLTVHESGLYLVYAQIHYLDEHDENGFHLLVNDKPVLQCMVFSPGTGHKSRSCFSAQVIVLQSGDYLILKEVGSARYTLFQHDKSFFGLVKLGEARKRQVAQENKTL